MLINNLINGIKNVIGISKIRSDIAKLKLSSDKSSEISQEDSLYETSFLQDEEESGSGILDKIANGLKKLSNILKNPVQYIMDALKQKGSKDSYSGFSADVQDVISQFSSNMDKMPKEVSSTIKMASKMFEESSSIQTEILDDGIKESVDVFDENGNKTGTYTVIKHFTGEIEIRSSVCDKAGKSLGGTGITIYPEGETIKSYNIFADEYGDESDFGGYLYSYDGKCTGMLNGIDFE